MDRTRIRGEVFVKRGRASFKTDFPGKSTKRGKLFMRAQLLSVRKGHMISFNFTFHFGPVEILGQVGKLATFKAGPLLFPPSGQDNMLSDRVLKSSNGFFPSAEVTLKGIHIPGPEKLAKSSIGAFENIRKRNVFKRVSRLKGKFSNEISNPSIDRGVQENGGFVSPPGAGGSFRLNPPPQELKELI